MKQLAAFILGLFLTSPALADGTINTLSTSVTTGNGTTTAQQASILLTPSSSYQRYFPYLPRGPIVVTCATTGDSIYVDTQ